MGSIVRTGECERFIKGFSKDLVARYGLGSGPWTVSDQYLGIAYDDEVRLFIYLTDGKRMIEVVLPEPFFVADGCDDESLVDGVARTLGISKGDARRRLERANLVRPLQRKRRGKERKHLGSPGKDHEFCDDCGEPVLLDQRCVVEELPVDIESANAGESGTLCQNCYSRGGSMKDSHLQGASGRITIFRTGNGYVLERWWKTFLDPVQPEGWGCEAQVFEEENYDRLIDRINEFLEGSASPSRPAEDEVGDETAKENKD